MKLKTVEIDGKTYAEVSEGKPVFVHDGGKEVAFDAASAVSRIAALNGEAKTHREAKEAAETKLKAFEGITDPADAKKALDVLKNLDAKKLVDAGEVEKVKAEAIKAVEEKYAPVLAERDKLQSELFGEKVGGNFARSKFIADKIAVPPDMIQAMFGSRFKVEDGKVIGYDAAGNKLFSRARPGEIADFDEALETIVDSYAHRDSILKGSGAAGSGAKPSNGGGASGGKTISRAEFTKLDPNSQMAKVREGVAVVDA